MYLSLYLKEYSDIIINIHGYRSPKNDAFQEKGEKWDRWLKFNDLGQKGKISEHMETRTLKIPLAMIDFAPGLVKAANLLRFEKTKRSSFGAFNFRRLSLAHPLPEAASICRKSLSPSSCRTRQRETNIRSIFHLSP